MRENTRMKKVLSILLCLCIVLSYVPLTVFAEGSSIVLFDGTHIVDTDTTVSRVDLNGGTLIISDGVTLTVTENFANNDGQIVNSGTITVLGTGHCFSSNHAYNTTATGSSCDTMLCAICKKPGTHTMDSTTGCCERCSEFVAEAKIGSTYYQKLPTAIENAQSGDTVILLQSVEGIVRVYIPSGEKITLDLNGFNWLNRIVNTSAAYTALSVEGELNLINSDTNKVSTVESVKYVADVDATGKLSVGANINFTAPDYEVGINSGIVDLSKADCENWKVKANGADLSVGVNLLLPENWKLKQDGTVVETVSNGATATIELPVQSHNLWVGGVEVTLNKTSGEGWSYDQATGTLTLNGATITGSYDGGNLDHSAGIYATEALNIVLTGNNTISGSNCGIYAGAALNISGDGSLTATGNYDAIKATGDITISGGTVTANGTYSYGICAEEKVISITGGYVTVNGGNSGSGIFANTVVLGNSSHLKVAHNSVAVSGALSKTGGLCRTSADGTFTDTIDVYDATYFEYIGSDHVTYTKKDAQNHTVACAHGISFDATHEYENGACVCTAEDPMYGCDFIVTGDTANYSWDKTNKALTINGGNVTVFNKDKNTATSQRIYIQGTANVTLDGVNISSTTGAPIEIRDYNDTNVTLTLSGSNTLISQTANKAAIHKTRGQQGDSSAAATLTINGSGSLTAVGGSNAAGIGGGGHRGDVHNIIINGGTISAQGTGSTAGIGSSDDGSTWNITINGGNITASGAPGIGANTDNWQGVKDASITGGMVITTSYKGSTPTGGLVSTDGGKSYTVYSDYTLSQDLTIADDGKLKVAEGTELTVADGFTLTNKGVIVNDGTISGNLANEGTIYNKGTLPANVGGSVYEQYVTVNNGSGTGIYNEGSTVTIAADAPASGKMFTGWTIELGAVTLADSTKAETTFTMPEGCVTVKANYADIVATVTDSNGNVTNYSNVYLAQDAWSSAGGTLTLYTDIRPFHLRIPANGVLDLNEHTMQTDMLIIDQSCTIQNGTISMWHEGSVEENVVVTFKNVTITRDEYDSWEIEIINNGTIVDEGLTLNGVTISGAAVKTGLTEDRVTLSGIPTEGYVYDGTAHEPGVKCGETTLVVGTDYTVTFSHSNGGDSTVNAGTITMTITGIGNYAGTVTKTYTITKAQAVGTAPTAVSGLVYNKSAQTLIAAGSTNDGTMVYSLEKEGEYTHELPQATAAGTYYVWYKVIGDGNHSDSAPVSVEVKISKAAPGIGAVTADVVNGRLEASAIVLTRANTNVAGNLIVDAGQTLVLGENEIAYTFVPTDSNYKAVTGTVTVTVVDTTAPTGTVTIATNNWTNFLNNITFGLFFKETQTVTVVATDNLSGVAKIEYIESKTAMDLDAVKAATQWTEMGSGSISVTLEDTKQFVYYIRITDKSGNVSYLSSDGAEYDTSAPVIAGVNNGVTYYTTQKVTINEKNIDTITLNGEAVTSTIALEGNKEATYIIVATDKAGNTTTVTVKMAPIADIAESMEGKSESNVTSGDKASLQVIVDTVTELLKDEELPAEEKEALEKSKADAEALLIVIENADKAADTENTDKVEDVTADNVTPDDKSDLEKAKADLEKALKDNNGNYTAEEKKAIEDELKRIDDALKVIENVEAVEDATSNLPATVVPDDEENVTKIEAAKKAYDKLTDHEKSLVDPETKEKLDKLTAAAVAYDIIKGDDSEWTKGTDGSVTFTVNGSISKFSGIKIDGKAVDAQYYDIKAGSTIITLKASYLETLAAGEHSITVVYTDGETSGTFNVQAKSTPPATGDNRNMFLWFALLFISGGAVITLTVVDRKRKAARK